MTYCYHLLLLLWLYTFIFIIMSLTFISIVTAIFFHFPLFSSLLWFFYFIPFLVHSSSFSQHHHFDNNHNHDDDNDHDHHDHWNYFLSFFILLMLSFIWFLLYCTLKFIFKSLFFFPLCQFHSYHKLPFTIYLFNIYFISSSFLISCLSHLQSLMFFFHFLINIIFFILSGLLLIIQSFFTVTFFLLLLRRFILFFGLLINLAFHLLWVI